MGDSTGTLDDATTTWFTTLCTGLEPVTAESAKIAAASTSGTDAEKLTAVSSVFTAIAKLYGDTGTALTALPAPGIPGGTEYAQKSIAAFGELADTFTAAATSAAAGDNSKVASLQSDLSSGPAAKDFATLTVTPQTKASINKIPACAAAGVIN